MAIRQLSLAGAVLVLRTATPGAAEKKIQAKNLPPAVRKAVQDATQGAMIKGFIRGRARRRRHTHQALKTRPASGCEHGVVTT